MVNERSINVGDLALCVAEAGGGGAPLLLVHGWTGAKEDFGDCLVPLADAGWHVVAPDLRGHGRSSQPAGEEAYSLESYAQDILGLADALGWDEFVLLGHSMGGMVAQVAALRAPQRLRGLVLMDTHHGTLELDPDLVEAGIDAARTIGTGAIADLMAVATEPGPLETEAHRRVCAERPGYFERGIENTRRSSPAMFAASLAELTATPSRLETLAGLRVPTLVLVGEQDERFLPACRELAVAIPDAQLVVVPEGGHSPQFEAPDAWFDALGEFLDPLR